MKYFVVKTLKKESLDTVSGDYFMKHCWEIVGVNFQTPDDATNWIKKNTRPFEECVVLCDYSTQASQKK